MKRIYLPVFTLLLLAACAEDIATSNGFNSELTFCVGSAQLTPSGTITRSTPVKSDYEMPLYMIVTSEPVVDNMPTRGTEVTTASINASGSTIAVRAYDESGTTVQSWCDGATATFNTTDKIFHTGIDWSNQSGNYDFYAWYPAASGNGLSVSGKTITYSIANLASSAMPDLLGAKATSSYSAHHGKVDLEFSHLLTPVCFKLAANYGGGTIKSIKFSSLVTSATCEIGTTTWTLSTPVAYTTQALSTTGSTTEVQVDGSQYFMMIPQTISAGTIITITTQKGDVVNTLTYTVPAGGFTWTAGQVVTYTISTSAVTQLTATYPSWTGGTGPVSAYEAGESFGLFAVDEAGKVVISNVQVDATSVASGNAIIDLTASDNSTRLNNYIISEKYTYYLMYPYKSGLSDVPTVGNTGHANQTADEFFNSVISSWSPSNDQADLSNFKAQDLQVAKIEPNTTNAAMAHKMGLDCITLGTRNITETRYFKANGTTVVEDVGTKEITASDDFRATYKPYLSSTNYYFIKKPGTTVTFNATGTADKDKWENALTPDPSAGQIANATAYPLKSSTRTKDGQTGDYYYKGWVYTYNGTLDPHTNGSVQTFTATQAGSYKLEVWGAQGGDGRYWNDSPNFTKVVGAGGKGGYTYGDYNIPNGSYSLYVCVGGQGEWANYLRNETTNPPLGGYNGGGKGGTENENSPENAAGGGGATHIATTNSGILANYSANQGSVLIVAGGGGGAAGDFSRGWNDITSAYGIPDNPTEEQIAAQLNVQTLNLREGADPTFGFFADDRFKDDVLITNYFMDDDDDYAGYAWGTVPENDKKGIISKTVYKWYGGAGGGGVNVAGQTTYRYSYGGPATNSEPSYASFGKGIDGYNVGSGNIGGTGGGGGGWYGGYHKSEHRNAVSAGGAGGSSHVHSSLTNTGGQSGVKNGDGEARIRSNFEWY